MVDVPAVRDTQLGDSPANLADLMAPMLEY